MSQLSVEVSDNPPAEPTVGFADVFFVVPGDLATPTGGYGYDRRLIAELGVLGLKVDVIQLTAGFPFPDSTALEHAQQVFADLPAGALVIVDGLALGALPDLAERAAQRLRLIALCHHPLALETGLNSAQRTHFWQSEKRALAAVEAVVVTSRDTADSLRSQLNVPADKITVAEPGTDPQVFAPCDGHPPILLTLASLTRRKGHNYLLEALAQITELPWSARFVGSDELDPEWAAQIRAQVQHLGLQDRVEVTGAVDEGDVSDAFRHADLFVLPSLYEGYGMAFAEALAFGLPIVAARAGAVPQLVPANAGILVPPADVQSLATVLAGVLAAPGARHKLQEGARTAGALLPRWHHTAGKVAALIARLRG
ncbi:MAG: glycosyltransferase family 1 protein [Gammaproteobacteria bacterium]|nr:MAG: glycosyltransferase family 1 protein [Gammaproteobacteria bacterium]